MYAAKDEIVLKLHLGGPVHKYGIDLDLDGDLYMAGHPVVVDNELRVPDLEPTIETSNFLLKLKAAFDGRHHPRPGARGAQARHRRAPALGAGEALHRSRPSATGRAASRLRADKIEVSGVHVHANYLRVYVGVIGRASVYLPCPAG